MIQQTFIIIKPNAVASGLVGEILRRYETARFRILAMKAVAPTREKFAGFYAEHDGKPFFAGLCDFIFERYGQNLGLFFGRYSTKLWIALVVISIGAFADLAFYEQVKQAAREGGAKVHLASGAIGGFDVLQTVSLMAQAQRLPEKAGIETHTGARGFRNTPVWADHLLTDTEKTTVFTGNAKEAIATFPRRVNVAVATSLATTGPEITDVTMHSVPNWVGDDHRITAEIDGVKAVVDIYSSMSAIAGWSVVALLRNLASPVVFY